MDYIITYAEVIIRLDTIRFTSVSVFRRITLLFYFFFKIIISYNELKLITSRVETRTNNYLNK